MADIHTTPDPQTGNSETGEHQIPDSLNSDFEIEEYTIEEDTIEEDTIEEDTIEEDTIPNSAFDENEEYELSSAVYDADNDEDDIDDDDNNNDDNDDNDKEDADDVFVPSSDADEEEDITSSEINDGENSSNEDLEEEEIGLEEAGVVELDGADPILTEEELDEVADTAINVLQDFLKYFNVGEVTIDEYEGEEGELILDITGADLAVLIGRHGKTLDALQFLVSAITVRKIGFRYPIVVDVEGYKGRQRQKLESIARSAANRAANQGRSIKLRPMTPYERRIVHITLRDDTRVETASEGEGSTRHVVVLPL